MSKSKHMDRKHCASGVYASGSFGLGGEPGGAIRIWFCGGHRVVDGRMVDKPCAHRTREEARECARCRTTREMPV